MFNLAVGGAGIIVVGGVVTGGCPLCPPCLPSFVLALSTCSPSLGKVTLQFRTSEKEAALGVMRSDQGTCWINQGRS